MLVSTIFFLAIAVSLMFGTINPVLRQGKITENFISSRQGYVASESGVEDVLYRLKNGKQFNSTEVLIVASSTATTVVVDVGSNEKQVTANGDYNNRIRKSQANVTVASGASFNYGVQVGQGGFEMENSSSIIGNLYSNGPVEGENSNIIYGDVVSAGPAGVIDGIHATSSAYAHLIKNSTIDKNAYYQTLSNTTVGGTKYSGSADQPMATLPISDGLITQWENDALAGGIINSPCPYTISSNTTMGPVKINCDLTISGSPTITLTGPIWVAGNISIKNSAIIKVSSSLGNNSVAIIADNPSNRSSGSKIDLQNSVTFQGSGGTGSYVLLISQNNSAEGGGDIEAIQIKNSANGAILLYAGHGEVTIENSSQLKEVTAYKIHIKNSAQVKYDTGLANLLFSSGPSGAWAVKSWKESQ